MNRLLPSWARKALSRTKTDRAAASSARPRLEILEDRLAPATLVNKSIEGQLSASSSGNYQYLGDDENHPWNQSESDTIAGDPSGYGRAVVAGQAGEQAFSSVTSATQSNAFHYLQAENLTTAVYIPGTFEVRNYQISASFEASRSFTIESSDYPEKKTPVQFVVEVTPPSAPDIVISVPTRYTIGSESYTFTGKPQTHTINARVGDTFTISIAAESSQSGGVEAGQYLYSYITVRVPVNVEEIPEQPDLKVDPLHWDSTKVEFGYEVSGAAVTADTTLSLYWAKGGPFDFSPIGPAIQTIAIRAETPADHSERFTIAAGALGAAPVGATHLLAVVDENGAVVESDETNNFESLGLPDIKPVGLAWDAARHGVTFGYEVSGDDLTYPTTISLYWAKDTTKIGEAIRTEATLPFHLPGEGGSFSIGIDELGAAPPGATHLLAVVDEPTPSRPSGVVLERDEGNNVETLGLPDVKAVGLDWDPVRKGVLVQYEIVGAPLVVEATYHLSWTNAEDTLIFPPFQGYLNDGVGVHTDFIPSRVIPGPLDFGLYLKFEADPDQELPESDVTNNTLKLLYDPRIESVTPTFDGDPSDDVIGRFFVGVPTGPQIAVVRVSPALAATHEDNLFAASLGTAVLGLTPVPGGGGRTYVTGPFDPGTQLTFDETLVVSVFKPYYDPVLGGLDAAKYLMVDMEPLPEWLQAMPSLDTPAFDAATQSYHIQGKLLEVQGVDSSQITDFVLPDSIWFGRGTRTQLNFAASFGIGASLDATARPATSAALVAQLVLLGQQAFVKTYTSGDGALTANIDLDPRSLRINTLGLTFKDVGSQAGVGLLRGQQFKQGWWAGTSDVRIDLNYRIEAAATLDRNGALTGGFIDYDLWGPLSGSLVGMEIDDNRAISVLRALQRANPGNVALSSILDEAKRTGVIPDFTVTADVTGQLRLRGLAQLTSTTRAKAFSFAGSIDLGLTGPASLEYGGVQYALAGLTDILNAQLRISKLI